MTLQGKKAQFAVVLLLILIAGAAYWFYNMNSSDEQAIASANGRLEATQIDIATKFQGRVAEILFDEGDVVKAGEIVARIDTQSLEAQLREAEAMVNKAQKERAYAQAVLVEKESECDLKKKNLARSERLYRDGIIAQEKLDEARAEVEIAMASCDAARAQIANAEASIKSAVSVTERIKSDIADCILKAPRDGRVQYRLAEPGEVLPQGGKVLTTIDLNDVYMTVFLPETAAGRVNIGSDARIVLDAFPDQSYMARVSFVASEAQFTPKEVETRTERQKLSFRVKVNLINNSNLPAKPGMPGEAYIRVDDSADWPQELK